VECNENSLCLFIKPCHHPSPLKLSKCLCEFFSCTIRLTTRRTSCLVFQGPILQAMIKKLTKLLSSSFVRYGSSPGFIPCLTRPEIQSFKVEGDTPNSLVAWFTLNSPNFTASIAQVIEVSSHWLRFLWLQHCCERPAPGLTGITSVQPDLPGHLEAQLQALNL